MADSPHSRRRDEGALASESLDGQNRRNYRRRRRRQSQWHEERRTEGQRTELADTSLIGGSNATHGGRAGATPAAAARLTFSPQLHLRTRAELSSHVERLRPVEPEQNPTASNRSAAPLTSAHPQRRPPDILQTPPRTTPSSAGSRINVANLSASSFSDDPRNLLRPHSIFMAFEKQDQRDYASAALNNWEKLAEWAQEQGCLDWKDEDGVEWVNRGDQNRTGRKTKLPSRRGPKASSPTSSIPSLQGKKVSYSTNGTTKNVTASKATAPTETSSTS